MSKDYGAAERELVPGALRGYRSWILKPGGKLSAVNFPHHWERGVNVAKCLIGHPCAGILHTEANPPVMGCMCGFYAAHKPSGADGRGLVIGSIKAYGKVLVGPKGFRAQKVEIESLAFTVAASFSRAAMEELWNVPTFASIVELTKEFPPIPVDHLIAEIEEEERAKRAAEAARRMEFEADILPKMTEALAGLEAAFKLWRPAATNIDPARLAGDFKKMWELRG